MNGCKFEEKGNTEEQFCRDVVAQAHTDARTKGQDRALSSDPEDRGEIKRAFQVDRMDRLEEEVKQLPLDNLKEPREDHSLQDAPSMNLDERPLFVIQKRDEWGDVQSFSSKRNSCK